MSPVALPPTASWMPLVARALEEDLGSGDVTSEALIEPGARGEALVEARAPLRVCGLPVAEAVFHSVDPDLALDRCAQEGSDVEPRSLMRVAGNLRSILAAERTALNFLMRMCGVASWTRRFVSEIEGLACRVVDTRKTLPGWRSLDKYATAIGGAENHRHGLYDALLIKDNHRAAVGGAAEAFRRARERAPSYLRIQIEVESEAEAAAAVEAGADWLLLDNCSHDTLRRIARRFGKRALLEASGGIGLDTLRACAETGVQRVSIGALTHSAPASDVALELVARS
jgi:nicotinate-nucleotide pyrophosphorylase (carboxylating)